MKVRTVLVLGLFWIFVLSMVSVSAVAADGLYWGDSVSDPLIDDPSADEPFTEPVVIEKVKKDKTEKKVKDEPILEPIVKDGLYWGD